MGLAATVWIPAFAGMTVKKWEMMGKIWNDGALIWNDGALIWNDGGNRQ